MNNQSNSKYTHANCLGTRIHIRIRVLWPLYLCKRIPIRDMERGSLYRKGAQYSPLRHPGPTGSNPLGHSKHADSLLHRRHSGEHSENTRVTNPRQITTMMVNFMLASSPRLPESTLAGGNLPTSLAAHARNSSGDHLAPCNRGTIDDIVLEFKSQVWKKGMGIY